MLTHVRLLAMALLCALVLVVVSITPAEAAVARVGGVTAAGQDHYNAKLRVRWRAVTGATYQVRWARSTAALAQAKRFAARTTSAYSPTLNRCVTTYVQVRAVRSGAVGRWSTPLGMRFTNLRPPVPKWSGYGLSNAVKFTWAYTPYATRYRVRWNAAPFGKFPGGTIAVDRTAGGWVNQYSRSSTLQLPTVPVAGDRMMGVAYANPVFAQFDANNICKPTAIPHTTFIPVFPKAPDPGAGDRVRIGTYNVELFPTGGTRLAAIADNIADHGLQVVALQEANRMTADALVARLGGAWTAVPSVQGAAQQILYRNDAYDLAASGSFTVPNPKPDANPVVTPWARLDQVNPSDRARSQSIIAVSVHLAEDPNASDLSQKASTGAAAAVAVRNINSINPGGLPVVAAGDLRYKREPFCDDFGSNPCKVEAPPTFVRSGYYDAMAALTKVGFQYTTVNGHTGTYQTISQSGVGTRSDYIMLKGFRSSVRYQNVINRFIPGTDKVTPSDHNLVLADLVIPYAQ